MFQFLNGHDLVKKKKFDKKIADTSFNQSPQGHFSEQKFWYWTDKDNISGR